MSLLRSLLGLLLVAGTAYVAVLSLLYVKQRSLLFQASFTRQPVAEPNFDFAVDGAVLRGWVLNPGQPKALLYFGGNGEDVSLSREEVASWAPGHTIYLVAYRGYGHSTGTPSEAALAADAIALFDAVTPQHGAVDVFGRSLGSGVAVHVAALRPVGRLALVTPFDSVLRLGQDLYPWAPLHWLMKDPFESWRRAHLLSMPALVVIAEQDNIIPPEHSEALVALMPGRPQVLRLPSAQHNNVQVYPEYDEAMTRFFAED